MEPSDDRQKTLSDVGEQILTTLGAVARMAEDGLVRGPAAPLPDRDQGQSESPRRPRTLPAFAKDANSPILEVAPPAASIAIFY
jgi:hypothetical protein